MSCTTSVINSQSTSDAICQYAVTACSDKWDLLDFFSFYFCGINENVPAIVILSIIIIAFTLNILGSTADKYLAPSLEVLSIRLKLSEAVAGVTFLAFANGAADVISGIVAGGKADDGLDIAVGGLFGACLFTITVVFARCIQGGGDIKVDKDSFIRDCCFLLIATVYFLILTLVGYVSVPTAVGFLLIYAFYIGVVFVQERRRMKAQIAAEQVTVTELTKISERSSIEPAEAHIPNPSIVIPDTQSQGEHGNHHHPQPHVQNTDVTKPLDSTLSSHAHHNQSSNGLATEVQNPDPDNQTVKSQEAEEEEDEDNPTTIKGKVLKYYNMPLLFIRNLTIFPFEEWNKWRAVAPPFLGTLFILWNLKLMPFMVANWWLLIILFFVAAAASAYLFFKGSQETLERIGGFFSIWAFLLACIWILLIVTCFLDFLALIEVISGLPLSFLSLTLIAWGTSMDDFFVDYSIAKMGHGTMAVIGVFGGQLFNMLLGFGFSLTRQTATRGTIEIDLYDATRSDVLSMILIGAQLFGLIVMLVVVHKGNYIVGRKMNIFLMAYYAIFLFSVALVSFLMKS